jgi:hypothetical protein
MISGPAVRTSAGSFFRRPTFSALASSLSPILVWTQCPTTDWSASVVLAFFCNGTAGGTGRGRVSLAHGGGAQQELHRNGRWERCIAGAERKEEDDGGGVG